jgi:gliding motility-associated-like protein
LYVIGEENGFVFTNNSTPTNSAFFWDFGDNSYSVLFNPNEKRYSKPDSFNVLLTATYGPCKDSVLKGVRVFPNMKIYIPNTFSPNNDGANDFLELYGNVDDLDHVNIKVFNRLGEKVYQSFDKHFHWDGTYNGKTLSPDVFVYTLELSIIGTNEKKMIKGSIALIR